MKTSKKLTVLFVILQIVSILSACSSGAQPQTAKDSVTPKEYSVEDASVRYSGEGVDMPAAGVALVRAVKSAEGAFLYGTDEDKNARFFMYNTAENKIAELAALGTQPAEAISAAPGGALHALRVDENGRYYISSLLPDGTSAQTELALDKYDDSMIYSFYATDSGFILDLMGRAVAVDAQGKLVQDYGEYNGSLSVAVFHDRTLLARIGSQLEMFSGAGNTGTSITELSSDFSPGQSYHTELLFDRFLSGADGKLIGVMNNTVYSYDAVNGRAVAIVNALASSMKISELVSLNGGRFLTVQNGFPYLWQPAEEGGVTVLNLAAYQLSYEMQRTIEAFNMSGAPYVINTIDYAAYDEYAAADSGMTRFAADIVSGAAPDIYDMSTLSPRNLASRGLLEDLKPYFSMGSIGYDELLPCVTKNAEFCGALYELIPSFSIVTICGSEALTGKSWSIDDFAALGQDYEAARLFGTGYTRTDFLSDVLCFMKNDLYSEETQSCNFNSDSFLNMLNFASMLPESVILDGSQGEPFGRCSTGEQLLMRTNLAYFAVDEISLMNGCFGGEAQFVGFPSVTGSGVGIHPCVRLGMSSSSLCKQGVWEFFEFLLSDAVQLNPGLFNGQPAVVSCYEKSQSQKIAHAIKQQPGAYGASSAGPVHFTGAPVDEAKMKQCMDSLVERADCIVCSDEAVLNIVLSCAAPFFAGDKSAADAANAIQSRVSIYLSEQYG